MSCAKRSNSTQSISHADITKKSADYAKRNVQANPVVAFRGDSVHKASRFECKSTSHKFNPGSDVLLLDVLHLLT